MTLEHFKLYELVDKKTFEEEGESAWEHFAPDALQALDELHDFFTAMTGEKTSITVNNWKWGGQFQFRGFRPVWYQPGLRPAAPTARAGALTATLKASRHLRPDY